MKFSSRVTRGLYLLTTMLYCWLLLLFCILFVCAALKWKASLKMTTEHAQVENSKLNARDERRRILGSPNYNRMGYKVEKKAVATIMGREFTSNLVVEMRAKNGSLQRDNITVLLAEKFGFCWGVERAISMAYEARAHYPDKSIHITNEIIHNPQVNQRLREMDVHFLEKAGGAVDVAGVAEGDVVILPAFGATIQEMQILDAKKVKIVDATCPWVSKVWNAVDAHTKAGQTSVIHGRFAHEETIATASFCAEYIIVKDLEEAEYVAQYIVEGGDKVMDEFLRRFQGKLSRGFDPDKHLCKVGLANQTTMYKRETRAIGRLLEKAMLRRYGPEQLPERYREFDTICDATQERQDAVTDLVQSTATKLDFVLVVGGFDSSNTAHLKEIPEKFGVDAFHIDRAECIGADNTIRHRAEDGRIVVHNNFLRAGPMTIGLTSGASTPDRCMEEALERIFMIHKLL